MARPRLSDPAMLLASVGGIGLLPLAPGTWGSLVGAAIAWVVTDSRLLLFLCVVLFGAGWWAAERVAERGGIADPGFVVIDEVVGQALVLAFAPRTLGAYAAGFVLFRIADILKPWPIRQLESRFRNGFGVMIDDIAAALYAGAVLLIIFRFYPEATDAT